MKRSRDEEKETLGQRFVDAWIMALHVLLPTLTRTNQESACGVKRARGACQVFTAHTHELPPAQVPEACADANVRRSEAYAHSFDQLSHLLSQERGPSVIYLTSDLVWPPNKTLTIRYPVKLIGQRDEAQEARERLRLKVRRELDKHERYSCARVYVGSGTCELDASQNKCHVTILAEGVSLENLRLTGATACALNVEATRLHLHRIVFANNASCIASKQTSLNAVGCVFTNHLSKFAMCRMEDATNRTCVCFRNCSFYRNRSNAPCISVTTPPDRIKFQLCTFEENRADHSGKTRCAPNIEFHAMEVTQPFVARVMFEACNLDPYLADYERAHKARDFATLCTMQSMRAFSRAYPSVGMNDRCLVAMNAFFLHHKHVDSEVDILRIEERMKPLGVALFGSSQSCHTQARILTSSWFRICPDITHDATRTKDCFKSGPTKANLHETDEPYMTEHVRKLIERASRGNDVAAMVVDHYLALARFLS